jgi:hypothetical protein
LGSTVVCETTGRATNGKTIDTVVLTILQFMRLSWIGFAAGRKEAKTLHGGERIFRGSGVLRCVASEAHKIENVVFGSHALPAFEHALGGTVMKRAGDHFPVHDLQQKAPAVHTDGINALSAIGVKSCSTMIAIGF